MALRFGTAERAKLIRAMTVNRATLVFERVVQLPTPVLHLVMLDSDRSGGFILPPLPRWKNRRHRMAVRRSAVRGAAGRDGSERGRLKLPPLHGSDSHFVP